jgi:hypothetical protein
MKTLIIQSSFPRTASTVLVNAVYGMIPTLFSKPVLFADFRSPLRLPVDQDILVLKTHETNLEQIMERFADKYKVYFVCSERRKQQKLFNTTHKNYSNAVFFDFDELNETPENSVHRIVATVYDKLQSLLVGIRLDESLAYRRLEAMNRIYAQIKHMPFDYTDPYFNIHGSHRSRGEPDKYLRGRG